MPAMTTDDPRIPGFTHRQVQVVALIARGCSNVEIADSLGVSANGESPLRCSSLEAASRQAPSDPPCLQSGHGSRPHEPQQGGVRRLRVVRDPATLAGETTAPPPATQSRGRLTSRTARPPRRHLPMTAGIAAATAIRSGSLEGSLRVTDEPFAHVLPNRSPRHVPGPRLTRLLDDARAQTLVLHAPAGYGKTSLAVEWLRERDDVAWFTAQPDSGDVGAAVLGVALAASRVVPGAADRVRQRLSIVEEPAQAARTFAEILAEDLADWPSGGVVAIDDYHHLAQSDAAESFIDWMLVLRPSLRILVATRRRPSWASARRVLAGEIVELEKRVLSMTNHEVT